MSKISAQRPVVREYRGEHEKHIEPPRNGRLAFVLPVGVVIVDDETQLRCGV